MTERDDPPAVPRRSASGRVPQWAIDEAAGVRSAPTAWRAPDRPVEDALHGSVTSRAVPRSSGMRLSRRYRIGLGVVVGLLVAAVSVDLLDGSGPTTTRPATLVSGGPIDSFPPAGQDAALQPLGLPPSVSDPSDAFRFIHTNPDGSPVTFDPCRPLRYVVSPQHAPPGGEQVVRQAMEAVAAATGFRITYDGSTAERPDDRRRAYQPDRYGDRWAPVLVSWVTAAENPDFAADLAGQAGSTVLDVDGRGVFVTGQILLDAAGLTEMLSSGRRATALGIVKHEAAHLVGLDHVNERGELMFPEATEGRSEFGRGDLTGLARLGGGACVPEI